MQVSLSGNSLLIEPESEFEEEWLKANYKRPNGYKTFLKYGLSRNQLLGLKIESDNKTTQEHVEKIMCEARSKGPLLDPEFLSKGDCLSGWKAE